jgi:hypothetical protein
VGHQQTQAMSEKDFYEAPEGGLTNTPPDAKAEAAVETPTPAAEVPTPETPAVETPKVEEAAPEAVPVPAPDAAPEEATKPEEV